MCIVAARTGITVGKQHLPYCKICMKVKQTQSAISSGPTARLTIPMEVLHTDVCGPLNIATFGGKLSFVLVINNTTRYAAIYLVKRKSEASAAIQHFIIASPHQKVCHKLRSNQGGEYLLKSFAMYLAK
jgi:hypothetical protein